MLMYVPTTFDVSNNIYCMCKLYRNGLSVSEYDGLILRGGLIPGGGARELYSEVYSIFPLNYK